MIGEGQIYVPVEANEARVFSNAISGSGDKETGGITVHFNLTTGVTGVGWDMIGRGINPPQSIPEAQQAIFDFISIKANKAPFLDMSAPWVGCWD